MIINLLFCVWEPLTLNLMSYFPQHPSVSVGTPNWDMTLMLELLNGKSYSVFQRWQDQGD